MRICIVGTGYVGLVSAACFAEMGNTVSCIDVNPEIVKKLNQGEVHIYEPGLTELVHNGIKKETLFFSTQIASGIKDARFIFITVGTPSRDDGSCDLSYVEEAAKQIGANLEESRELVLVVNKSTVPIGTADIVSNIITEELEKRKISVNFEVVSNPEFLKEGDAVRDFMRPDRVVVGTHSKEAADLMHILYAPFARSREKLMVMGVRSAEMTKYAANCMLATKISFINEIAGICEKVGADVRDVRMGIGADHRIGYHFIYPGVGYGGSCFPKDVKALVHTANEAGAAHTLINAVEDVNNRQKIAMAKRVESYFNGELKGKTLALWGLAFKANTDDMREAAALYIIEYLTARGMKIAAFDPIAGKNAEAMLEQNKLVTIVNNQYEALKNADALLLVTEWNQFRTPDFAKIKNLLKNPVIFDGRNLYDDNYLTEQGFEYFCVGRA